MSIEEVKVRSTIGDLIEFKKSIVWIDIRRELIAWKKGFENELKSLVDNIASTNPSSAQVLTHLGDINGRMKAVDYLLSIPDIFIGVLESNQKNSKEEIKDGD